jgi:hypothetical protein
MLSPKQTVTVHDFLFNRDPERILLFNELLLLNHFSAKFVAASAQRERLPQTIPIKIVRPFDYRLSATN